MFTCLNLTINETKNETKNEKEFHIFRPFFMKKVFFLMFSGVLPLFNFTKLFYPWKVTITKPTKMLTMKKAMMMM